MAEKYWYLVVLEPQSTVGRAYLKGNNDGVSVDGCPVIRCDDIRMDGPLLFASRIPSKGPSHQDLYIPYSAVSSIFRGDKKDDVSVPFGFQKQS